MADEESNLVPFPRGAFERRQNRRQATLDELPVRPAEWKPRSKTCLHERSFVDEQARTVRCRECDVELDPIHVLSQFAHRRESLVLAGMRLRDEVDSLSARVERLRKDETNAKARIRKARKGQDDRAALEAAAQATYPDTRGRCIPIGGYRGWQELSEPQREVVLTYVRAIVEAYRGALDDSRQESRTA